MPSNVELVGQSELWGYSDFRPEGGPLAGSLKYYVPEITLTSGQYQYIITDSYAQSFDFRKVSFRPPQTDGTSVGFGLVSVGLRTTKIVSKEAPDAFGVSFGLQSVLLKTVNNIGKEEADAWNLGLSLTSVSLLRNNIKYTPEDAFTPSFSLIHVGLS